jgi:hypothetical protein
LTTLLAGQNKTGDAETLQPSGCRLFLDRIVHLPVPSENVNRRGKKISESLPPTTHHDRADGTRRGTLKRKI